MNLIEYKTPEFFIRSVTVEGEPWFAAKDVCTNAGISKYRDAIAQLDEDELMSVKMDIRSENGITQAREIAMVSESGLYTLMIRSRHPKARPFRRWVTHEVLPAIRRDGVYQLRTLDLHRIKELEAAVVGAKQTLEKKENAYWRAQEIEGQYSINVYVRACGLTLERYQRVVLGRLLTDRRTSYGFASGWQRSRRRALVERAYRGGGWYRARTWPPEHIAASLRGLGCEFAEPTTEKLREAEMQYRAIWELRTPAPVRASALCRGAAIEASQLPLDIGHGGEVHS